MAFDLKDILETLSEKIDEFSSKIPFLNKEKEAPDEGADEDEQEQEAEDEEKKEKRSRIIKIIVILAIAFFVVDEFLLKKEAPVNMAPKKKIKIKKDVPVRGPEVIVAEKRSEVIVVEKRPEVTVVEKRPEVIVVEKKPELVIVENGVKISEGQREEEISSVVKKVKREDLSSRLSKAIKKTSSTDSGETVVKAGGNEEVVAKYVSSPKYESLGRGLVYNCIDGHWACVDQEEFFSCVANEKWNKRESKKIECFAKGSYRTIKDCRIVQLYNVNMAIKAAFCK